MAYTSVIRQPHLLRLWLSQVLSSVGDQLYNIAALWIAIKTGGANAGFVAAAGSITGMCLGLVGGVYADRWNRRTTMIVVDLLRALTVLSLAMIGQIMPLSLWHLGLSTVIISALDALFDPSMQASLPELCKSEEELQSTNALMQINHRLARTLGPGAAGWLVALMPVHQFFTLDGISFIVSAFAIFSISSKFNWKAKPSSQVSQEGLLGIFDDMRKGAQAAFEHKELFWCLCMSVLSNFAWSIGYTIGFPLWVKQTLHADVGSYGALVAAYGVGAVTSNILVGMFHTRRRMLMVSLSDLVFCFGFCVVAMAPNLPLACLGAALAAIGGPMADIILLLMTQTDIPRDRLGKVHSLRYFMMFMGSALGLLCASQIYNFLGAQHGMLLSATVFGITGTLGLIRFGAKESIYMPAQSVDSQTLGSDLQKQNMDSQTQKACQTEDKEGTDEKNNVQRAIAEESGKCLLQD